MKLAANLDHSRLSISLSILPIFHIFALFDHQQERRKKRGFKEKHDYEIEIEIERTCVVLLLLSSLLTL